VNLLKTSFLTLISTSIKILSGLVINKAISIFIGPAGLALIGQFQNALQMMMTLSQGGINTGVTKYTAEYGENSDELPKLWSTGAKIVLACSAAIGASSIVLSGYFSEYVFKSDGYRYIFIVLGFTLVFFSLNQLLLSIINGLKEIKFFISINITQSVYSLFFTSTLIALFGLDGALIALVTNQSVVFIIVLWKLKRHKHIVLSRFREKFDGEHGKKLAGYSLMALTSALTVPLSHLLIRNHIGETLSWDDAGYWQAIWYISSMYLMVITTALSTYYLPRLSEITSKVELRKELKSGYVVIVPIVLTLSFLIFLLKDFIVWSLFSEEFKPMIELFKWQLVGDVIKIAAWLLSYLMVAKVMTRLFIITEVLFSVSFVFISMFMTNSYGLIGITYSYVVNCTIYFLVMLVVTRKSIF
tara:strand:- start:13823 stop:15067 length:1245 start_codon:yes stop_codon:yes gene_type:complete